MIASQHVAVVGGGLVGSLLSLYLKRNGYPVSIFERRSDPRKAGPEGGRSINLALSNRGLKSLREIGLDKDVSENAIPMHGRMMHAKNGDLSFLPYGRKDEYINSISRGDLNILLLNEAERNNVDLHFDYRCLSTDPSETILRFDHKGTTSEQKFEHIIGADGAFSAVRSAFQVTDRFNYSQHYLEHGYKEIHIPAVASGHFVLEKNALHIWPRESYMLIALPNLDGSFTGTLFLPFEGNLSFQSLQSAEQILDFFESSFPDIADYIPDAVAQWAQHPASSLVTISCEPWSLNDTLLIGDAAHAIVPFYGQGMNAGFEDCLILERLLQKHQHDWKKSILDFETTRKKDTEAIAQLALDNFIEMRDLVADPEFLLRKKIEAKMHALYPDEWIPLYSMVTFHDDLRYSDAQRIGYRQKKIMDEVMKLPDIEQTWPQLDFARLVKRLCEES